MSTPLQNIDEYLRRQGFPAAPPPTLESLRALQQRHTAAFPFESLSTLMHRPVPIDVPSIERKLLHEGRGGYCYELNGLYLALLTQLGFDARALDARAVLGRPADAHAARTHMLILVTLEGASYICDVGFGGLVPTAPLRLSVDTLQVTPHEAYRLTMRDSQYLLSAQVSNHWCGLYRFDLQTDAAIDQVVGNWYVSTHPDSPFIGRLAAARTGPGLRKTLSDASFAIHHVNAATERRELPDADAVMAVLREEFNLRLPGDPALREAIAARVAAGAR